MDAITPIMRAEEEVDATTVAVVGAGQLPQTVLACQPSLYLLRKSRRQLQQKRL